MGRPFIEYDEDDTKRQGSDHCRDAGLRRRDGHMYNRLARDPFRPLDAMPTDPRIGPFRVAGRGDRMQEGMPNPLRDIRRSSPDSLPDLVEDADWQQMHSTDDSDEDGDFVDDNDAFIPSLLGLRQGDTSFGPDTWYPPQMQSRRDRDPLRRVPDDMDWINGAPRHTRQRAEQWFDNDPREPLEGRRRQAIPHQEGGDDRSEAAPPARPSVQSPSGPPTEPRPPREAWFRMHTDEPRLAEHIANHARGVTRQQTVTATRQVRPLQALAAVRNAGHSEWPPSRVPDRWRPTIPGLVPSPHVPPPPPPPPPLLNDNRRRRRRAVDAPGEARRWPAAPVHPQHEREWQFPRQNARPPRAHPAEHDYLVEELRSHFALVVNAPRRASQQPQGGPRGVRDMGPPADFMRQMGNMQLWSTEAERMRRTAWRSPLPSDPVALGAAQGTAQATGSLTS